MTKELQKELRKIAFHNRITVRFVNRGTVSEVDVNKGIIIVDLLPSGTTSRHISDFFHEMGHIVDYRQGLFSDYYQDYPSKQDLKKWTLKAEKHADDTGNRLMKSWYPERKFVYTYKYKKWQKFLKQYWGI